jgi:hypothetical protein
MAGEEVTHKDHMAEETAETSHFVTMMTMTIVTTIRMAHPHHKSWESLRQHCHMALQTREEVELHATYSRSIAYFFCLDDEWSSRFIQQIK